MSKRFLMMERKGLLTEVFEYFISLVVTAVYHIMKENKVCPGHTFKTTKKMDIFFQLMNIYLTQTALEDH